MSAPAISRKQLFIQLTFLAVLMLALLVVCVLLGVFRQKPADVHEVLFRVTGSAHEAVVTYTLTSGTSAPPISVILPWRQTLDFPKGTLVVLTASNPSQAGSLQCEILLDSAAWKKQRIDPPANLVSCTGLVP